MEIKSMETESEKLGKGIVHYQARQEAYANLLPQSYLSSQTVEHFQKLALTYSQNNLVALVNNQVVGFVCYGKSNSDDLTEAGEIYALYILREYYGQGIGYALLQAALEKLQELTSVCLWVLEGNKRAISFYKKIGFRFDGTSKLVQLGQTRTEYRMVYQKTNSLNLIEENI